MKTIGILGGMSWESSALYYQIINEAVNERLGGQHNARSVMVTVDFDEIEKLQHADLELPVFDTTVIHALSAVEEALS